VAVGFLVVIPLISLAIFAAAQAGIGEYTPGVIAVVRLVSIFAGLPALATAGGVGRLAAEASLEGGRPRAMWVAGRAMAVGGAGLVIIGAIPCEVTPLDWPGWVILALVGLVVGAASGAVIGLACGGPVPSLTELGVWPQDGGTLGRAVERVVTRAMRRRRASTARPADAPPGDPPPP
jgi:hypothetical protein